MLALPSKSGESAPSDEALIERIAARHFRGWRRLLGAAPGVLLAVALAAQARVRRAVHTVVIDGVQFIPAVLEVGAGGTVARVEHDPFPQAAIADREGVDSGNLPPELAWASVPKRRGVYPCACALRETMKGRLIVK